MEKRKVENWRIVEREGLLLICLNQEGEVICQNSSAIWRVLEIDQSQKTLKSLLNSSLVLSEEAKRFILGGFISGKNIEYDQDFEIRDKLYHFHFALENIGEMKIFFIRDESEVTYFKRKYQEMTKHLLDTLAVIAHETINPLVSMVNFARHSLGILRSGSPPNFGELIKNLEFFEKRGVQLEKTIKDLLFKEELEHGGFPLCKKLIKDLYIEVIAEVLTYSDIAKKLAEKRVTIDHRFSLKGIEASVFGDQAALRVVYRNLFENAIRYVPVEGRITYGIEENNESYELIVYNEGEPIDNDFSDKMFQKRVGDGKGSGLGLFICQKIIQLHNGKIWAEKDREEGVKITFTLPKL
ncbi:MAG: HAMP domain-containing sensor histidine kinase [Candidatus Pacebacteria bacterium]|nr:HAMP domain-containing sensor histidine kinase [Candidatus Paceibacterota bacterium]